MHNVNSISKGKTWPKLYCVFIAKMHKINKCKYILYGDTYSVALSDIALKTNL